MTYFSDSGATVWWKGKDAERKLETVLTAARHLDAVVAGFLNGELTLKHLREAALTDDERGTLEELADGAR